LSVDPVVAGAPTTGWSTTVSVSTLGLIVSGSGWLGGSSAGPAYPLISAPAAFALLPQQPVPLVAIACPAHGACPGSTPRVVTGARLGLSLEHEADGTALLVPAWLFTVRGSDQPVAQVAVAPQYLAAPPPGPVATNRVGTMPGGPPASSVPGPAAPSDPRPSSYTTSSDGRTLTVEFGVGVCPPAMYAASAKEFDLTVVVTVTATGRERQPASTACIDLARIEHASVHLTSPLAGRTVRDEDGSEVRRG
jgi:hypothetical protein